MDNYIYEYHKKIQSKEIIAGKWIAGIYSKLVSWLDSNTFYFNKRWAIGVITFIESLCRHSKGRNDLLKLELWQKAMISAIFGIVDKNGLRVFREVFIVIGRKNGKSILASTIMAVMAFFDGEYGAEIYCLAPKLDQANIVFSENFHEMIKKEPELLELIHKRKTDIYIPETNTIIKPIAFSYKKSDGYNPHLTVNDELAQWPAVSGLRQYGVMRSARGARKQPMILSISTAGYVNDGIYDELFARATSLIDGKSKERRFLPFIYQIDDVEKWNDINELKKANPNMGISIFQENFKDDIAVAEISYPEKAEFLMKYCNIKQNSSIAWFDQATIEKAARLGKNKTLRCFNKTLYAVGGIDLSQTTDLTAACVIIQEENILYPFVQFFMPSNRIDDLKARDGVPYDIFTQKGILTPSGENTVNYKDILKWFVMLEEEFKIYVQMIGYDKHMAGYLIEDLKEAGFHTDDVRQGPNLTPIVREFEGLIRDGHFAICNNSLLESHFYNAALKQNLENRSAYPVKIEQRSKIDGLIAVMCALTVRQKHWPDLGAWLVNQQV